MERFVVLMFLCGLFREVKTNMQLVCVRAGEGRGEDGGAESGISHTGTEVSGEAQASHLTGIFHFKDSAPCVDYRLWISPELRMWRSVFDGLLLAPTLVLALVRNGILNVKVSMSNLVSLSHYGT